MKHCREIEAAARPRRVDPQHLLSLFRGADFGGWDPHDHNFGLYTIVIGAQTLHATGYAMGVQRDGLVGTGDSDRDMAVLARALRDAETDGGSASPPPAQPASASITAVAPATAAHVTLRMAPLSRPAAGGRAGWAASHQRV